MTFRVEFTPEAEADLDRLFDFLLDRAETVEDAMRAYEAIEALRTAANSHLSITPYSYRKAGPRPTLRELIVPFGTTGGRQFLADGAGNLSQCERPVSRSRSPVQPADECR